MKNISNNTNSLNLTSEFEIQFLVAIFAMILITTTLTVGSKSVDIFAQGNNSNTNSTNTSQSDNQTTGVDNNLNSNLPYNFSSDIYNFPETIQCHDESACNSHYHHGK